MYLFVFVPDIRKLDDSISLIYGHLHLHPNCLCWCVWKITYRSGAGCTKNPGSATERFCLFQVKGNAFIKAPSSSWKRSGGVLYPSWELIQAGLSHHNEPKGPLRKTLSTSFQGYQMALIFQLKDRVISVSTLGNEGIIYYNRKF